MFDEDEVTVPTEDNHTEEMPNDTCHTFDCINASIRVSDSINPSVDPCNDFYEFACAQSQVDPFSIDSRQINMELNMMINSDIFPDDSREMKLVRKLYNSCMKQAEIKSVGLKQLKEIIRKIGGWPLIEGQTWNGAAYDWIESIRQMRDVGLNPTYLFSTSVLPNFKNSSIRSLTVIFQLRFFKHN